MFGIQIPSAAWLATMPIPTADPDAVVNRCPPHTKRVFDMNTFPRVAAWALDHIKTVQADAIVACGHSGLVLAGAVSILAQIPVFAVRKQGETSVASSPPVSGIAKHGPAQRFVWLDDFCSTGGTMRRSIAHVWRTGLVSTPVPAALIMYGSWSDTECQQAIFNNHCDLSVFDWMRDIPDYDFRGATTVVFNGKAPGSDIESI